MAAYLIHAPGVTALVEAHDAEHAYDLFVARRFGAPSEVGRLVPPARDELVIRALRAEDRAWLEEHDLPPAFLVALADIEAATEDGVA